MARRFLKETGACSLMGSGVPPQPSPPRHTVNPATARARTREPIMIPLSPPWSAWQKYEGLASPLYSGVRENHVKRATWAGRSAEHSRKHVRRCVDAVRDGLVLYVPWPGS